MESQTGYTPVPPPPTRHRGYQFTVGKHGEVLEVTYDVPRSDYGLRLRLARSAGRLAVTECAIVANSTGPTTLQTFTHDLGGRLGLNYIEEDVRRIIESKVGRGFFPIEWQKATLHRARPGRAGASLVELAIWAQRYVVAAEANPAAPVRAMSERWTMTRSRANKLLYRARDKGLLDGRVLTPLADEILDPLRGDERKWAEVTCG